MYIFSCIQNLDSGRLITLLDQFECEKAIDLMELIDENGYTLIHASAFNNSNKITDFLIKYLKENLRKHYRKQ